MWEELRKGIIISKKPYIGIIFSDNVLKRLKNIVNKNIDKFESGGLLLGYIRKNHFDVRIITTPYKNDFVSRYLFIRKDKRHLNVLQSLRLKIDRNLTFIGEWHTHPEDKPKPSTTDLKEWQLIKSTRNYPIVFMILGRTDYYITVK